MNNTNDTATKQAKENEANLKNDIAIKAQYTINKVKAQASNKAEQISEITATYKAKVSDNLSGAAKKVHQKSDTAQDFLSKQADKANEYTHQAIKKVNQISHRAADALKTSSEYVKNFDLAETTQQVKKTIKQKPGLSLGIVGIFGLLIGLLVGRRTLR